MSKPSSPPVLIYTTWPDSASARSAAGILLSEKLIACCNIIPAAQSIYIWEGEVQESQEVIAFFKTTRPAADRLSDRLAELHPYETPAIIANWTNKIGSSEAFSNWVAEVATYNPISLTDINTD